MLLLTIREGKERSDKKPETPKDMYNASLKNIINLDQHLSFRQKYLTNFIYTHTNQQTSAQYRQNIPDIKVPFSVGS